MVDNARVSSSALVSAASDRAVRGSGDRTGAANTLSGKSAQFRDCGRVGLATLTYAHKGVFSTQFLESKFADPEPSLAAALF
ncbi:hypothetical protein WMY93_019447 [Mugilogobius chulae]|uniref:Uncharacterized protein n=1 Tax=Mugilogobius chulae TaxID=88201 RepID=A0AAW0NRF3_9GOBI